MKSFNTKRIYRLRLKGLTVHEGNILECNICHERWTPSNNVSRRVRRFWVCPNKCNVNGGVIIQNPTQESPKLPHITHELSPPPLKGSRFSVSLAEHELRLVDKFVREMGVSRNEFIRRATLAYIVCHDSGHQISVKEAWQKVDRGFTREIVTK